jgi:hypothetical protein
MAIATAGSGQTTTAAANPSERAGRLPTIVLIFILSLFLPFFFTVGPMLMTASRLVLLLTVVPCLFMLLSGRAGRVGLADIALLAMCAWTAVSLSVVHGPGFALEPAGIVFVETMGAYLLARCFIRDADTFFRMVRCFVVLIALMLPFALIETLTGRNVLLEMANSVMFAADDVYKQPRWGLDRVQGVFEHPIHFGVICGSFVALAYYVIGYGRSFLVQTAVLALVTLTAGLSLSSGPLTAIVAQLLIIGYDRTFFFLRERWILLFSGTALVVLLIELVAERPLPKIFIHYFAFNIHTAYNRIHIWEFGTQNVADNPIFGIGLNDWARPDWMGASMDMFWLVPAVKYGLPAAVLLQVAVIGLFVAVMRTKVTDPRVDQYRMGYLVCIFGLYMAGWTVHYWKVVYLVFMFLVGSGAWILEAARPPLGASADPDEGHRRGSERRSGSGERPSGRSRRRAREAGAPCQEAAPAQAAAGSRDEGRRAARASRRQSRATRR